MAEVIRTARARFRPLEGLAEVRGALDAEIEQGRVRQLAELFALLEDATDTGREGEAQSAATAVKAEQERLSSRVRALEDEVGGYVEEIDRLEAEAAELRGEADELRDALRHSEWRSRSLQNRLRSVGVSDAATAANDAETAFIEEIRDAYERRYLHGDREDWPLGDVRLHPEFLLAVDKVDVDRSKLLEVCADVASGRARTMDSRQVHQLRTGDSGGAPVRVRSRDGAAAWRCSLQHKTPSARRLHWWALPGGGVEFAHVGLHDDMACPE